GLERCPPERNCELANRTGTRGRRASEPTRSRGKTASLGDLDKGRDALDAIHGYCIYRNNFFQRRSIIVQHEMIHIGERGLIPPHGANCDPGPTGLARSTDRAMTNTSDTVSPPAARRTQAQRGSARAYEKRIAAGFPDRVTPELATFIAELDTAFLGTVSADGAPYIQHRGGAKG